MKIDLYTKTALTVIAVCLVIMVFRSTPAIPLIPDAQAASGDTPVTKVEIVGIADRLYTSGQALPVRVVNGSEVGK